MKYSEIYSKICGKELKGITFQEVEVCNLIHHLVVLSELAPIENETVISKYCHWQADITPISTTVIRENPELVFSHNNDLSWSQVEKILITHKNYYDEEEKNYVRPTNEERRQILVERGYSEKEIEDCLYDPFEEMKKYE